jgi:hypothetical protein
MFSDMFLDSNNYDSCWRVLTHEDYDNLPDINSVPSNIVTGDFLKSNNILPYTDINDVTYAVVFKLTEHIFNSQLIRTFTLEKVKLI